MLKNKKAIYLLIPLNLLVWGFFTYRIYSAFGEEKLVASSILEPNILNKGHDAIKKQHKFDLSYLDPFLKTDVKQKYHGSQGDTKNDYVKQHYKEQFPVSSVALRTENKRPEIKYLGLIKNSSTGIAHAIISLNGQSIIVKKGQVSDGITFKQFTRDSMVAKWGKELVVIKK